MFPSISSKQSFPELENEVLAYWKEHHIFEKSVEERPKDDPYRFYDGPPFITGTPHYGSLLSSVVKDVVGRYWTMRGKRVERVWGWDCHGLPIEEKVQKQLNLHSNRAIEKAGVKHFIDTCYEYTQSTSEEWRWYIDKIGRWVDMDNAYRTMDQDYMESVMWVFKELWEKGLIYKGKRVSLYSWKLGTPISNFEVAMDNTYQSVNDPAITVRFVLEPNTRFPQNTTLLAWTTTPWTIPGHLFLGVGADILYALVHKSDPDEYIIVAKNRIEAVMKGLGEWSIEDEFLGSTLAGLRYIPPFQAYYQNMDTNMSEQEKAAKDTSKAHTITTKGATPIFSVYSVNFASDCDGTGIVHCAPEFGDVDFGKAKELQMSITEMMDEQGKYTKEIFDMVGTHYLDANKINTERMKENGTLFKNESITHRIPFCPRSGTPLVQKAQSSWFIDIASNKERLLEANESIYWFPEHLKHGRFRKNLEGAPDWCISRTRYWGAPMPVWISEDGKEKIIVGSRKEIFELNQPFGQLEARKEENKEVYYFRGGEFDGMAFNLHKPYIDSIKLRSPKTGNTLMRIPEVLDVWMDSGSMPYAQMHYPFENKKSMEASFPADFIAEYVGQVRAWFHVMHVLGVLLNPTHAKKPMPSFTNVITTGVINGNDGRKMSKSYGNYPDPRDTIEKYGADPIRFYMLNSPLLSGGDMDFKEAGIVDTIKTVMLPLWNTYSFFTTYANIDGWDTTQEGDTRENPLDTFILSKLHVLIGEIQGSMERYDISRATRALVAYMDTLTNWYVRLSRRRFWASDMTKDKKSAYTTLWTVLVEISKLLAPFMPFLAESIFRGLTEKESVHLELATPQDPTRISDTLNRDMELTAQIVSLGLALRARKNIRVRQPLSDITITTKLGSYYTNIICDELNVKNLSYESPEKLATKICKPDARKIGPKYGKEVQTIIREAKAGNFIEGEDGVLFVPDAAGWRLEVDEYTIEYLPKEGIEDVEGGYGIVIALDTTLSDELILEGYARDIIRTIQDMRKEAGYKVTDTILLSLEDTTSTTDTPLGEKIVARFGSILELETLSKLQFSLEDADIEKEEPLSETSLLHIKIKKI